MVRLTVWRSLSILLPLFALIACSQQETPFGCEAKYVSAESKGYLPSEKFELKDTSIQRAFSIEVIDSVLVFFGENVNSSSLCYAYSTVDGSFLGSFINKGRGPNELMFPMFSGTDIDVNGYRQICINDMTLHSIVLFDVLSSVRNKTTIMSKLISEQRNMWDVLPREDSLFWFKSATKDHRLVYELSGTSRSKIYSTFIPFPQVSGAPYLAKMSSFDLLSEHNGVIAMAMPYLPHIYFYNIESEERRAINVKKEYATLEEVVSNKENPLYYGDMVASDSHLFGLFSGFPRSEKGNIHQHIHIFDWNGRFIYDFELDAYVDIIAFSEKLNTIFGADLDGNVYKFAFPEGFLHLAN